MQRYTFVSLKSLMQKGFEAFGKNGFVNEILESLSIKKVGGGAIHDR